MEIAPPCKGGVIALNGKNGSILWKQWMNDSIFSVSCNADINKDGTNDCLIVGKKGVSFKIDFIKVTCHSSQ